MQVICKQTQEVFEIDVKSNAENTMPCPNCSPKRKKKTDKCMSFNGSKGMGTCYHDGCTFYTYQEKEVKENYKLPEWKNYTDLNDLQARAFEKRMIGQATLQKMNISNRKEWLPKAQGEVDAVCFPYYKNGELINVKYRGANKDFKTAKDAELIWYNYDAIKANKEIIIVEGEFDALSFIQEGFENVISVPNGVNSLAACFEVSDFEHLDKIYLAVDQDEAGLKLESELLDKLGSQRCRKVSFLPFKDANEYLCQKGFNSLKSPLNESAKVRSKKDIELDNILQGSKLDPTKKIEKPPVIFSIKELYQENTESEIGIFSLGDLSLLQGLQKSKKTWLNSGILASMLNSKLHDKFIPNLPNTRRRVAFFDTEQSDYYGQMTNSRIYKASGSSEFDYFCLRTMNSTQRRELIERYLQNTPECCFIIIDGIVDCMEDFNDITQSKELVQWLMTLTNKYYIHALNVLHENFGDSQKARGHLGSFLAQKAETVMRIEKKLGVDSSSTVSAKNTRGKEFKEFDLVINGNGELCFHNLTQVGKADIPITYQGQLDMPAERNLTRLADANDAHPF